jgi:glycosyltransferase involved in cell wall biosynthesis
MKQLGNTTSLLIAQVEPPQKMDGGDYFYRTYAPGIAMAQEEGVYVANLTNQHRRKAEIMTQANILILKNICDPDLLPLIRDRKKNGKLTVYEIADNLNALQPWNPVYFFYNNKENLTLVNRLASCCDALQTTCHELKGLYGHLNDNYEVFPNQISHIPHERPVKKGTGVIIGWGGSHGHLEDVAEIADSLIMWINKQPNVSLHLMCSEPIWKLFDPLPEHKKKRTLPGTIDDYYNFLRGIDIGIAPLKDTAFNRSRSDVKFLEYAVSGVVPVMAYLEPYTNSVDVGKTGFLFKDTTQLINNLNQLLKKTSLSRKITKAARQHVLQERLQLEHGRDRLDFYSNRLKQLGRHDFQDENVSKHFEEWSQLEGAVRNERHLQFQTTRFENLLHDGLVAMQTAGNKKLAHQFFEEAAALESENYLPFLFGASVSPDPIMSLNKALELKPDSIKAWTLLGEEFAKKGEIKEALKSFDSAAKVCLDYEIPYLRVAVLLKKLGERSQSDWFFKKAKEASIPYAFA